MRRNDVLRTASLAAACVLAAGAAEAEVAYYGKFREAPVTAVKPAGELRDWCRVQAEGLGRDYADSGYPYNTCLWAGVMPEAKGNSCNRYAENWWAYEQTGYLVDGLGRLGILLDDARLTGLLVSNVEYVITHPRANGLLGPAVLGDSQWGISVFSRAMTALYDKTGDRRIVDALARHCAAVPGERTEDRDIAIIEALCWLYRQTGERKWLDDAVRRWRARSGVRDLDEREVFSERSPTIHGVSGVELAKLPALLSLYTGDQHDLAGALNFFRKVFRDHELADGMPSCYEAYKGPVGLMQHETCDINDDIWGFGYLLMATGDAKWADRIERIYWNAGRACVTPDFRGSQYFSGPNQVYATEKSWPDNFGLEGMDEIMKTRIEYRPGTDTECCAGNVHRINPSYVARMWMTRASDGAPTAVLYGASDFATTVGGTAVTIEERTDYPYDGTVVFTVRTPKPVAFPLVFRIPAWAEGATAAENGVVTQKRLQPGRFHAITRTFGDGDTVTLDFPMTVRQEWFPAGLAFYRGALLYSYPIPYRETRKTKGFKCTERCPARSFRPTGPWNWGVRFCGAGDCSAEVETVGKGRSTKLRVKAKRVAEWTDPDPSREVTPFPLPGTGSFEGQGEEVKIDLVPMASAPLRVSVFPEFHDPLH